MSVYAIWYFLINAKRLATDLKETSNEASEKAA
jgi:hypothetical protein